MGTISVVVRSCARACYFTRAHAGCRGVVFATRDSARGLRGGGACKLNFACSLQRCSVKLCAAAVHFSVATLVCAAWRQRAVAIIEARAFEGVVRFKTAIKETGGLEC